jgi:hypothetical protein
MVRRGWLVLRMLLLVRFGAIGNHTDGCISVSLPFTSLSLCSFLAFDPLTLGFAIAGAFA